MPTIRRISHVDADLDVVWAHCSSMKGVNHELWPIHMSHPRKLKSLDGVTADDPRRGQVLFTSRVTLLRVIPLDLHRLRLDAIDPPHGFSERSTSLAMKRWNHDRSLARAPRGGTFVADHLSYRHRIPGMGLMLKPIYAAVFRRRHRRLVKRFGHAG